MLGVADLHTPDAIAAAESAIAGYQATTSLATSSSSETESEASSNNSSDSDDDDAQLLLTQIYIQINNDIFSNMGRMMRN